MLFTFAAHAACLLAMGAAPAPAAAQAIANPVKNMLGQASDRALDRLSQPGGFSADQAVRIALPGTAGQGAVGQLMDLANRSGAMDGINAQINRAAEQAAGQAKPIFRAAIDRATWKDALTVARGSTGATDYLRSQTQAQIQAQLLPLVRSALQQSGALQASGTLAAIGMGEDRLIGYVTDKTTEGIFTTIGQEETKARQDPIGTGRELLKGFKF